MITKCHVQLVLAKNGILFIKSFFTLSLAHFSNSFVMFVMSRKNLNDRGFELFLIVSVKVSTQEEMSKTLEVRMLDGEG